MTPLTRKENYLNEIVGWGNTAPEKPLTPEEFFFAAILGEAVQTPEPLSRYQIYLAKIAGRNISVPKPLTRLELFLAKACGMDIETPTPITREEIFWSNYTAIVDFEVEGVPPLTYKAIEGTLENYRIYGNTENGESVGDLMETGEHAGEYRVPVTVTNVTDTQTTNLYLPEQIKKVGDDAEYIDYGEQKMHRVRKNLLPNRATSQTIKGVTFTVNSDGSVTCNGTATGITFFEILMTINQGSYIVSGAPAGSNIVTPYATIRLRVPSGGSDVPPFNNNDFGTGITISSDKNNNNDYFYKIRVPQGYTCDNLTFCPMIRKADIEDDTYEPYIENTELDITLPALPTLSGTNTLSVETTVQPSKVMIKTGKFGTHKVRYYDSDGTFLSAEDVKDGTNAQGFTPTKTSTVQYNYTFMGWSTTKGSTIAETGVLNDITADKLLYAVFSQSLRTFTVYFYNGSTLLQTAENVQYGGTATYTGETPTKDGFAFTGWLPSNVNITADTSCYAQFVEG